MTTTQTQTNLNGLDVEALQGAVDAIRSDPKAGLTHWSVRSQWKGGCRSDSFIDGFEIGGEKVGRRFTLSVDEPLELTGTNEYANPQEFLLTSLNSCMISTYVMIASLLGIRLTKLEIQTEGGIDLRGFLRLDESIPQGYGDGLRYRVTLAGDASDEQLRDLHERVKEASVNYYNVNQPIALDDELVIAS